MFNEISLLIKITLQHGTHLLCLFFGCGRVTVCPSAAFRPYFQKRTVQNAQKSYIALDFHGKIGYNGKSVSAWKQSLSSKSLFPKI